MNVEAAAIIMDKAPQLFGGMRRGQSEQSAIVHRKSRKKTLGKGSVIIYS